MGKVFEGLICLSNSVASGHLDNNIRIWDLRSGQSIQELTGIHSGQITSVKMAPSNVF